MAVKRRVFLGAVLLFPCCALGRIRVPVYDFQLVECELVVVARIEPKTLPGRALKPDEGGLPGEAAQHGITLHVTYECLLARKPRAV